jgi:CelD/BcsL family acetyltransferase involved in cellulose biosynthesis
LNAFIVSDVAARPEEWDHAWAGCGTATYSQSRDWAEVWQRASGGRYAAAARRLVFSDGAVVVVPLTRRHLVRSLGSYYYGSPAGTYGGWLAHGPLSPEHARALRDHLLRSLPGLWWRLNPFEPATAELAADEESAGGRECTQALSLTAGYEAVWSGSHRSHRKAVNKARREGLTVRRGSKASDWESYYRLYRESVSRWGKTASSDYDWPLFEALRNRAGRGVELWIVERDSVIAAQINLQSGHVLTGWGAAGRAECFHLRPMNLLTDEIVRDACARGLDWFDLHPSGGHEGVIQFKRRLGAVELPAPVVTRERLLVPYVRWVATRAGALRLRAAHLISYPG